MRDRIALRRDATHQSSTTTRGENDSDWLADRRKRIFYSMDRDSFGVQVIFRLRFAALCFSFLIGIYWHLALGTQQHHQQQLLC